MVYKTVKTFLADLELKVSQAATKSARRNTALQCCRDLLKQFGLDLAKDDLTLDLCGASSYWFGKEGARFVLTTLADIDNDTLDSLIVVGYADGSFIVAAPSTNSHKQCWPKSPLITKPCKLHAITTISGLKRLLISRCTYLISMLEATNISLQKELSANSTLLQGLRQKFNNINL